MTDPNVFAPGSASAARRDAPARREPLPGPLAEASARRTEAVISGPARELLERIKLVAVGGVALPYANGWHGDAPVPTGFIFRGESAAAELAQRADLDGFRTMWNEHTRRYRLKDNLPQRIHLQTHGEDTVLIVENTVADRDTATWKRRIGIILVMPAGLRADFEGTLRNEPGFANVLLRETAPLFVPQDAYARESGVRESIFLEKDFSGMALLVNGLFAR
jgi:hypothetical protein